MNRSRILVLLVLLVLCVAALFYMERICDGLAADIQKEKRNIPLVSVHATTAGMHSSQVDAERTPASANGTGTTSRPPVAAAARKSPPETNAILHGETVFRFYDQADRDAFIRIASANGCRIMDSMDFRNAVRVWAEDPGMLERTLAESPAPVSSEPNYKVTIPKGADIQPVLSGTGQQPFGNAALRWLGQTGLHDTAGGKGVTVAVLDTGILDRRDAGWERIVHVNMLSGTDSGEVQSGHGTAMASLLLGCGDDFRGAAPHCTVLDVRVLGDDGTGDSFGVAAGIVEAVNRGAKVISLSLGTYGDSLLLRDAIGYAIEHGSVVVAAVGNDGQDALRYPAGYDEVVAVSAVDASGQHVEFANSGAQVDLAAPGVGVTAAWTNNTFGLMSGTSVAVPFVSGTLAVLFSDNADLTSGEAVEVILACLDDAGIPGADPLYGSGILDIGRIERRDERGYFDVAVGDVSLKTTPGGASVVMYVQNRGTELLDAVNLHVDIAGTASIANLYKIGVGETQSREFQLRRELFATSDEVRVSYSAQIVGVDDADTLNNARSTVIRRVPQ